MAIENLPILKPEAIDFQVLQQKYGEERAKRLRSDGVAQYKEPEGPLKHFKPPSGKQNFKRDSITVKIHALIVGGGYGGIMAAVRLIQRGITDFCIVEQAGEFGGTWYWNQYPGVQCDIESYIYMPMLEELGYMPSEKYAHGAEILKHINMIAEHYNLAEKTYFHTSVKTMDWDEKTSSWMVGTDQGDCFLAAFTATAPGPLHKIKLPGIPGMESYKGPSFHSSRWDYEVTGGDTNGNLTKLANKRVGIIGTGSTAVQILPHLAKDAKQVYVFQRTPSAIFVRNNFPTDPAFAASLEPGWQRQRVENFNNKLAGVPVEDLVNDAWTQNSVLAVLGSSKESINPDTMGETMMKIDFEMMERVRARVDDVVEDPETARKLKPWYGSLCKRPCFHDEYLKTFNQPNVELVDTDGRGVQKITEKGVVANGKEYEVDILIYSTGFQTYDTFAKRTGIIIKGRESQNLDDKWNPSLDSLHGFATRGFPNYFFLGIDGRGIGPNMLSPLMSWSGHIAYIIARCKEKGIKSIEPTTEAEKGWMKLIDEGTAPMAHYFSTCTPGFFNGEGKFGDGALRAIFGGGLNGWEKVLDEWRENGSMDGFDKVYSSEKEAEIIG